MTDPYYLCVMKLFLDDYRMPYDVFLRVLDPDYIDNKTWIVVRDYYEYVNFIMKYGVPELVSFDHDLSQEHYERENQQDIDYVNMKNKTGFHAAEWLIKYCKENNMVFPKYKIHSQNEEGSDNIRTLIKEEFH